MSTPTRESTDSEMSQLYTERDQLQRDLNERDEQLHDLEQRRRGEFDAGQAAERRAMTATSLICRLVANFDTEIEYHEDVEPNDLEHDQVLTEMREFLAGSKPAARPQGGPLSELEVLRAAVTELEALRDARVDAKLSQGEPVARVEIGADRNAALTITDDNWLRSLKDRGAHQLVPLYADQPAPVAVVMPEQLIAAIEAEQERLSQEDYLMDSEDCVKVIREEVTRLNTK